MDKIKKIWPKWNIVETLGKGGFGTVYKAVREEMGGTSYSAIKVINIPNDNTEIKEMTSTGMSEKDIRAYYQQSVMSLVSEIRLMEKLKAASNIVSIDDFEVVENTNDIGWTIYIRMELLTNIQDYFKDKTIQVNEIVKLGIDICSALEHCHSSAIVHRDIKPGNIFVSTFGDFKLGDFGVSREIEKSVGTMSQKGTKSYMAPEMMRMEKYGKTVDLYALGLTIYELLNHGRMPFLPAYPAPFFPPDRENALIKRLTGETFPDIQGIGELNTIIHKACAFNPQDRYQSATEMKKALIDYYHQLSANTNIIETDTDLSDEKTIGGLGTLFFVEDEEDEIKEEEKKRIDEEPVDVVQKPSGKDRKWVKNKKGLFSKNKDKKEYREVVRTEKNPQLKKYILGLTLAFLGCAICPIITNLPASYGTFLYHLREILDIFHTLLIQPLFITLFLYNFIGILEVKKIIKSTSLKKFSFVSTILTILLVVFFVAQLPLFVSAIIDGHLWKQFQYAYFNIVNVIPHFLYYVCEMEYSVIVSSIYYVICALLGSVIKLTKN